MDQYCSDAVTCYSFRLGFNNIQKGEETEMNKKQLLISLVVLAVLCLIVFNLLKKDSSSWNSSNYSAGGENLFSNLDVNKISKLTITSGTGTANIVRKDNGWAITEKGDYPADFRKIATFLGVLAEVKSIQDIKAGKSQLDKLVLSDSDKEKGNAILAELSENTGKKPFSILLGKMHFKKEVDPNPFFGNAPDGRYVMVLDGKVQPKLINQTFDEIGSSPISWADKSFVAIEKIKSIDVPKKSADESWKLVKKSENDSFSLDGAKEGEELEQSKISPLSNLMKNVSFQDVSPSPADFAGDTAVVETFDGFKYEITFAPKEKDQYSVNIKTSANIPSQREAAKDEKPEDKEKLDKEFKAKTDALKEKLAKEAEFGKWVYVLSKHYIDALLKTKKELLKEKKAETQAAIPAPAGAKTQSPVVTPVKAPFVAPAKTPATK
jgi:hypothetical protein